MTEVMAAEIEKLIERLEKATGPDRELDGLIAAATNKDPKCKIEGHHWYFWVDDEELGENCTAGWMLGGEVPEFTKSIDAALTLVPEGQFVNALNQHQNVWRAEVGNAIRSYKGRSAIPANSPAIALCIACLKAIAALRALSHKGSSND